ncbi:MAG: hypothetical protein DRR19_18780 [Candidatus Parabeggiatoa sp. nov. 1]|nr:MAG: hypothetical protein DRR19_18780 [Gammaproteobacteria bacterium]
MIAYPLFLYHHCPNLFTRPTDVANNSQKADDEKTYPTGESFLLLNKLNIANNPARKQKITTAVMR